TFANLRRVQPGFDTHNLIAFQLPWSPQTYRASATVQMMREAEARLGDIPGVASAVARAILPFRGTTATLGSVIEARRIDRLYHVMDGWRAVSPGYFAALRIPVLRGGPFSDRDSSNGPPVVVINQAMADKWWPHGGALGQRISLGKGIGGVWDDESPREIVGI